MNVRWKLGILAAVVLALFTLYPQLKMVYLRSADWNGHYAYNDIDEVAYASYVRALIDGRPRKNDPYSGRDDSPEAPQPESLFSIQFAAPYTIALPARILGIGAPWAMTFAGVLAGSLAALAAFGLIARMTENSWYAMAAGLVTFACGTLGAGEGAILEILFDGFSYPYFPGFRRYIPGLAMPAIFAMFAFTWQMLTSETGSRKRIIFGVLAVACFAYTVFSYFYIWTTAAAWFGCLALLWAVERPEGWRNGIRSIAAVGAGMAAVLIPYAYMLSNRSETLDHVQLLVHTRAPDLFRTPEYIAFGVLLMLIFGIASRRITMKEPATLMVLSLALTPFIIFNQQLITGRSLQPIHYQVFIGNYVAVFAAVAALGIILRRTLSGNGAVVKAVCSAAFVIAAVWGVVECHYTVRVLDDANIERDMAYPVAKRLEEIAANDPDKHKRTIFALDMIQADDLPSVAPQNVLWARHQHVFAGLSWEESKERYYKFLHFQNVDEKGLDHLLKKDFVSQIALFGWGRHTDRLTSDSKPLTYGEIDDEVERYEMYRRAFNIERASTPLLSHLVVNNEADSDLSVIQQWYSLGEPEVIGKYTIYPLTLISGR